MIPRLFSKITGLRLNQQISIAHSLNYIDAGLAANSKCRELHGHNLNLSITIDIKMLNGQTNVLDDNGLLVDFHEIVDLINRYDHKTLSREVATVERFTEHLTWLIHDSILKPILSKRFARERELAAESCNSGFECHVRVMAEEVLGKGAIGDMTWFYAE